MSSDTAIALVLWGAFVLACSYGAFSFARGGDQVGQWVCLFMALSGLIGLIRSI